MGSMLRFDSDRRELVRERREARLERKRERRQARERKHAHGLELTAGVSVAQQAADERVRAEVDRITGGALEHHDEPATSAPMPAPDAGSAAASLVVAVADLQPVRAAAAESASIKAPAVSPGVVSERRVPLRERDIAEFRDRRQDAASGARREARARVARAGEPGAVADALAATSPQLAPWWRREREQLDAALAGGRVAEVGAAARRALWAASRDAARSSRRSGRDPELALAVCVAYAIIARLPRTALRRARPARAARVHPHSHRAFWR
jgi:hypothetical protein